MTKLPKPKPDKDKEKKGLTKKDFVTYGPRGEVKALFCKICGVNIADTIPRPGPHVNSVPVMRFSRNALYAEIKFDFDDGSFHVTNGCKDCLKMNLTPAVLQQLYDADMVDALFLPKEEGVKPVHVLILDLTAGGIV